MDIKEKNALIKKLLDTEDDAILDQVKAILEIGEKDFWEELSPELKASIEQGLKESEEGKGRPHVEVMKEIRSKYQ